MEVSGDMMDVELADMAIIGIGVSIYPYDDNPFPQERIDRVTKDGTSTQVLIEEKYGGIFETIVESPSNPKGKGFQLYTNTYQLTVLGKGLPLEEYERIFLNIFERQ